MNSSPLVADGSVYFGSVDGNFYALDARTGKVSWKFQTGGERRFTAPGIHGIQPKTEMMPDPFDLFLSSPALADGEGDSSAAAMITSTRWTRTRARCSGSSLRAMWFMRRLPLPAGLSMWAVGTAISTRWTPRPGR